MSAVVDKVVRISADRAQRLEQLASERAISENALVEESLDLLFANRRGKRRWNPSRRGSRGTL